MERMTTKRKDGRWAIKNDDGATPLEQMNKIPLSINRLAAYEDTGLEPEEIDSEFINQVIEENRRLKELAQAKKDGRLVVLLSSWSQDYLTREEAETELKKREEADNETD